MQIEIHKGSKIVISLDLTEVNALVKTQLEAITQEAEVVAETPAPVTPSEDDILGGDMPVATPEPKTESKSEAKRKEVMKEAKAKAETKAEAKPVTKPVTKPAAKKEAEKAPEKKPEAVKYDRLDAKHREAFSAVIEATLGKDWKVEDSVRNKVGDFSRDAHGKLAFLLDGKVCASFSEAFAKHMGKLK